MIDADRFEMVDTINCEALRRHPVWSHFEDGVDRERVLEWGVTAQRLDAELTRLDSCGLQPLYPVLELDPLPKQRDLIVAVRFCTPRGAELEGYLFDPLAFGVFVGEREFAFNRKLPGFAERTARRLAEALDQPIEAIFPLAYATDLRTADGRPLVGRLETCW